MKTAVQHSNTDAVLTVCVITYNHANYVERALRGVLDQRTSFNLRIIVADDCSTDGTVDVLRRLQAEAPERIRLILREENIGPADNWLGLMRAADTPYVAYLEGDDYWTDDSKLQQQVDALADDSRYSLCFHDALKTMQGGVSEVFPASRLKSFTTFDVIVRSWFCPSSSIVMRREVVDLIPDEISEIPNGDILLLFLASTIGDLLYLNETMSVYNFMSAGSMSSSLNDKQGYAKKLANVRRTLGAIDRISGGKYRWFIRIKKVKIGLLGVRNALRHVFR